MDTSGQKASDLPVRPGTRGECRGRVLLLPLLPSIFWRGVASAPYKSAGRDQQLRFKSTTRDAYRPQIHADNAWWSQGVEIISETGSYLWFSPLCMCVSDPLNSMYVSGLLLRNEDDGDLLSPGGNGV